MPWVKGDPEGDHYDRYNLLVPAIDFCMVCDIKFTSNNATQPTEELLMNEHNTGARVALGCYEFVENQSLLDWYHYGQRSIARMGRWAERDIQKV